MADLHYLELLELSRLIESKAISPVEVTKHELSRIDELDGHLRSYAMVLAEAALEEAARAEAEILKGDYKGPLHGVPLGIKDLCWTKGVPAAGGMAMHRGFRPEEDATVVRRLREAGAIVLGKLQMTEGAYSDHHPKIPAPRNPWGHRQWPGVSSSGSGAATAAGLCFGSLGSDTGGSIRFPSAANGLTGLKPTWGRVSRYGAYELAATLDHIGPMTRSAADAAAMLRVLAGADENDPTAVLDAVPDYLAHIADGVAGLRIGIDPAWNMKGTDAKTQAVLADSADAFRNLGADMREIRFPEAEDLVLAWAPLCGVEAAVAHEQTYPSRKDEYGPTFIHLLELGRSLSGMDYQKIVLKRIELLGRVNILFKDIDLLLVPAQTLAAPTNEVLLELGRSPDLQAGMLRFTSPFDMTGHPTITMPGGFTEDGMPVGFQLVSARMNEALLFQAGAAYQNATDWHRRHPGNETIASH